MDSLPEVLFGSPMHWPSVGMCRGSFRKVEDMVHEWHETWFPEGGETDGAADGRAAALARVQSVVDVDLLALHARSDLDHRTKSMLFGQALGQALSVWDAFAWPLLMLGLGLSSVMLASQWAWRRWPRLGRELARRRRHLADWMTRVVPGYLWMAMAWVLANQFARNQTGSLIRPSSHPKPWPSSSVTPVVVEPVPSPSSAAAYDFDFSLTFCRNNVWSVGRPVAACLSLILWSLAVTRPSDVDVVYRDGRVDGPSSLYGRLLAAAAASARGGRTSVWPGWLALVALRLGPLVGLLVAVLHALESAVTVGMLTSTFQLKAWHVLGVDVSRAVEQPFVFVPFAGGLLLAGYWYQVSAVRSSHCFAVARLNALLLAYFGVRTLAGAAFLWLEGELALTFIYFAMAEYAFLFLQ